MIRGLPPLFPTTNLTRGLVAQWLFRTLPCHEGTIDLQTFTPSSGFEPSPYCTTVSVTNHYTEWAAGYYDEAHFWLNGYVNKQNCRIGSEANPQVYVETPLHPEKLTVWCALWAGGIIGPYFFKNDEDHNVTVNGHDY
ncbi:putative DD41D transposase [Trichonephila clavipes]|nr:putative DD41D transposase [Trichonephila clavipes]